MEYKAHFVFIGFIVLATFFASMLFVAWISNTQFDQTFDEYQVVFNGPVRGLSQGSEVHYNGLKVGEVIGLRWDEDNSDTVISNIRVDANTPVHVDSTARLEPQGLTGLNYIQITSGDSGIPFSGRQPWRIVGEASQIDTFISDGESLLESTQVAIRGVNRVLSPQAIQDFQGILSNLNIFTHNLRDVEVNDALLESTLLEIKRAAENVSAAAEAVDNAANDFNVYISDDVGPLTRRLDTTVNKVDSMLESIERAADGGNQLTIDARSAINRISSSGIADLEIATRALNDLITTLNEIADEIERNPQDFIGGREQEVLDIPQ